MDVVAPASGINSTSSESWRWDSPIPYLYGGLAAVLGLIALALLVLACSHPKSPDDDMEDPVKRSLPPPEFEQKILVVMAGNTRPTYLAKPVSSIYNLQHQPV